MAAIKTPCLRLAYPLNAYVSCADRSTCDRCGWNPENVELRQRRVTAMRRKLRGSGRIRKTYQQRR